MYSKKTITFFLDKYIAINKFTVYNLGIDFF